MCKSPVDAKYDENTHKSSEQILFELSGRELSTKPTDLGNIREFTNRPGTCCDCLIREEKVFMGYPRVYNLGLDDKESTRVMYGFKAEIIIDGTSSEIHVLTKLYAINRTSDASISGNIPITDHELKKSIVNTKQSIETVWNSARTRIKMKFYDCPEKTYRVIFHVDFVPTPVDAHYLVSYVNVPMNVANERLENKDISSWPHVRIFSNGNTSSSFATLNIQFDRFGGVMPAVVSAHEYGHMLGVPDEYEDKAENRSGVLYIFERHDLPYKMGFSVQASDTYHHLMANDWGLERTLNESSLEKILKGIELTPSVESIANALDSRYFLPLLNAVVSTALNHGKMVEYAELTPDPKGTEPTVPLSPEVIKDLRQRGVIKHALD